MWPIVGILSIATLITIREVPQMWHQKMRRELWSFSVLLVLGVGLNIIWSLNKKIPNPLDWITALYEPFSELVNQALQLY